MIELTGYYGVQVSEFGRVRIGPAAKEDGEPAVFGHTASRFAPSHTVTMDPQEALNLLRVLEAHRAEIEEAAEDETCYQARKAQEAK
jgi:hypothetical protein